MMRRVVRNLITEKDAMRGLVPGRQAGSADHVYGAYLSRLNPRENEDVQLALAASNDNRFKAFLERVISPKYKRVALQTIAKGCGIDLAEFIEWYKRASTQTAIATAQQAAPRIVADMVEDAKTRTIACERCDGMKFIIAQEGLPIDTPGYRPMKGPTGEVMWVRECPACLDGKSRKPGDQHSRDRLLQLSGLVQTGKAAVSIVQNFGGTDHSTAIASLDGVPSDVTEIIDVEVLESDILSSE